MDNPAIKVISSIIAGFFMGIYIFFIAICLPALCIGIIGGNQEIGEYLLSPNEGIGMTLFKFCIFGGIIFSLYTSFSKK
jgi:hypothetical protein